MAHAIRLQNPSTGSFRVAYEGISWTCFLFGPFPALFRGDIIGFGAMVVSAVLTFGLSAFVWTFAYNAWHRNRLIARGFELPHLGGRVVLNQHFALASSEFDKHGDAVTQRYDNPFEASPSEPAVTRQARAANAPQRGFGRRTFT